MQFQSLATSAHNLHHSQLYFHHLFIISLLVNITNVKATCSPSCSSSRTDLLFCFFLVSFSQLKLLIYFRPLKSWLSFGPVLLVRAVSSPLTSFLSHTLIFRSFLFSPSFVSRNFIAHSTSSNCQGHAVKCYWTWLSQLLWMPQQ